MKQTNNEKTSDTEIKYPQKKKRLGTIFAQIKGLFLFLCLGSHPGFFFGRRHHGGRYASIARQPPIADRLNFSRIPTFATSFGKRCEHCFCRTAVVHTDGRISLKHLDCIGRWIQLNKCAARQVLLNGTASKSVSESAKQQIGKLCRVARLHAGAFQHWHGWVAAQGRLIDSVAKSGRTTHAECIWIARIASTRSTRSQRVC